MPSTAELGLELEGEGYGKSEHRHKLIPLLNNRSEGSVEFKHQNISAVLNDMGFPYLHGYQPRQNYQQILYDTVKLYLEEHPLLLGKMKSDNKREKKYWAFIANPNTYDIEAAIKSLDKDTWRTGGKDVNTGDGIIFWRSLKNGKRGIIALGKVLSAPKKMKISEHDVKYYISEPPTKEELRVWLKYKPVTSPRWIDEDTTGTLKSLSVSRGQGGKPFQVTAEQWDKVIQLIGGWSDFDADIFPIMFYSWAVYSSNILTKQLDKSAFLHRGTGIPFEIRKYLGVDILNKGEKQKIFLYHQGASYEAHFEADNQPNPRTRLFWTSDFTELIRKEYPSWYQAFQTGQIPEKEIPTIRFEKKNNGFDIQFIHPEEIELDIQSEVEELFEPRKEGKVTYSYSKKYERDLANRQKAVEIHGLTCVICGFNFEEFYGEVGKGYIAIHHTKPLCALDEETEVNPETDMVPVCANCHAIIHRRKDQLLEIDTMKKLIVKQ